MRSSFIIKFIKNRTGENETASKKYYWKNIPIQPSVGRAVIVNHKQGVQHQKSETCSRNDQGFFIPRPQLSFEEQGKTIKVKCIIHESSWF